MTMELLKQFDSMLLFEIILIKKGVRLLCLAVKMWKLNGLNSL